MNSSQEPWCANDLSIRSNPSPRLPMRFAARTTLDGRSWSGLLLADSPRPGPCRLLEFAAGRLLIRGFSIADSAENISIKKHPHFSQKQRAMGHPFESEIS